MIRFSQIFKKESPSGMKNGDYLKYAIGEIVLVVLGILIALSINNWNTNRLDSEEETVILNNLIKELNLELNNLAVHKTAQNIWINSGSEILKNYTINNTFLVDDKLLGHMNDLMIRSNFTPNVTTYQTLESTGKINLIENKLLKDEIIVYYNSISFFSENTKINNSTLVDELINQKLINLTFFKTNSFSKEMKEWWPVTGVENYQFQKSDRFIEKIQVKLKDSDNAISLINIANFRMFLANAQLNFVKEIESDIMGLLKELEDELDRR